MQQDDDNLLLALLLLFAPLSLSAFGGGIAVISAIEHQVVDVYRWMTGHEFLVLFAIGRGAPGPGATMLTTLIGWKVAGFLGAVVATVAMFLPSSLLCVATAAVWRRFRGRAFTGTVEKALVPIGAGLLVGGVVSLGELVSTSWTLLGVAVGSSLACLAFPAINPLIPIGIGAAANVLVVALG